MMNIDLPFPFIELKPTLDFIDGLTFTPVKTKYISNGWSAVSIQGYGNKTDDLLKPNVLGSKVENDELVKTDLYHNEHLKPIVEIINQIPSDTERIRLMKLSPKTTIRKHTDKVDKDFVKEKIVRIHVPLKSSDDVIYYFWNKRNKSPYQMQVGNYYYLDVRFPHSVENQSNEDRLNLVVDVFINKKVKDLIYA